jgi:hypothetical protein
MTLEIFVSILVISAAATSIAIEILKNVLDKVNIEYKSMPFAVVVAFVIGIIEVVVFASRTGFSYMTVIYAVCMGLANVIGSNVGYDKVKEFIYALFSTP